MQASYSLDVHNAAMLHEFFVASYSASLWLESQSIRLRSRAHSERITGLLVFLK